MWDSIPGLQDHNLAWRQLLNQLSYPGGPVLFLNKATIPPYHYYAPQINISLIWNTGYSGSNFHLFHKHLEWFLIRLTDFYYYYSFIYFQSGNLKECPQFNWLICPITFFPPFFEIYWRYQANIFFSNFYFLIIFLEVKNGGGVVPVHPKQNYYMWLTPNFVLW